MRTVRRIIVHHSAGSTVATVETIDAEHRRRGFSCIGYHWLIHQLRDGGPWQVSPGRPEPDVGAHDQGQNSDSIGICLAGDYTRGPVPPDAWEVLCAVVANRCRAYGLTAVDVEGHGENEPPTTPTACPGYDPFRVRERVAQLLASWP